jgi:transposase
VEALPSADSANHSAQRARAVPFACQFVTLSRQEHIHLVWQGQHWKRLHEGATQRIAELQAEHRRQLQSQAEQAQLREQSLRGELEQARGRIRDLEHRLFSRKSERSAVAEDQQSAGAAPARKRGQQRGAAGHGRTLFSELPIREEIVSMPSVRCAQCGKRLEDFPGTEDSEVLEIEVQAYRRRIRRKRYRPTCGCEQLAGIVSAPPPARLIDRGKLGISVWVEVLLDKFLYGRASHRWMGAMADLGVRISPGTLCGGLRAMAPLFEPLYQALLPCLRGGSHWHIDETRWEVFVQKQGKAGHRWWLWVFQSAAVTFYVLDPSRSCSVLQRVLNGVSSGLISCDRHGAYKKFSRLHPRILLCFCWSHQRCDFLNLVREHPALTRWAMQWVGRIGELFERYAEREEARANTPAYRAAHRKLHAALSTMARERTRSLQDQQLPEPARKLLQSMQRHWKGLRQFIHHFGVPPDNNAGERALRGPVVGRKNFYGSGSEWSGQLAAMMFSLLMTMKLWQINPRTWLKDYLTACASAGNRAPPDLQPYLPWSMEPARLAQMRRAPCENTYARPVETVDTS